jgi:DNA-binding transcriptional ArsR family regulator
MAVLKLRDLGPSLDVEDMVENARQASDFLKVLSQETRLLILCLLSEGEKSVGELEEFLGQRQSTVSQQLARLRFEGLVATRREGKLIYYSLASEEVSTILAAVYKIFCKNKRAHRR